MHEITYPLRIFWKIIYKLDNTIDPKMQHKIIQVDKFEPANGIPIGRIVPKRINPNEIKLDNRWITSFNNLKNITKRKNIIKIDNTRNIKIKTPNTMENNDEMENVNILSGRHSIDYSSTQSSRSSVSKRIIGYRTTNVPIYEDEENLMAWIKNDKEAAQKKYGMFIKRYSKTSEENKCHYHILMLIVYIYPKKYA